MSDPLVSIIIPSFNHERYIAKAIESALSQEYKEIEILIADDCSSDSSKGIIESFNDTRIKKFFFNENRGTARTLNFLMSHAKGDYIATLGSDDYFYPDKIAQQVEEFKKDMSLGAVFSWANIVDEYDILYKDHDANLFDIFRQSDNTQGHWCRLFFDHNNLLCHSSSMISRNAFKKIGFYNVAYRQLHDFDYWIRLVCSFPIKIIQEPLVAYRRVRKNNLSISGNILSNQMRHYNEQCMIFLNFFNILPQYIFEDGFNDLIIKKKPLTYYDVLAEKYFILQSFKCGGNIQYFPSIMFISPLLNNNEFIENLIREYHYNINDFYNVTANNLLDNPLIYQKVDIDYLALKEELGNTKDDLAEAKKTVQDMKHSFCWRITRPLRFIMLNTVYRLNKDNKS